MIVMTRNCQRILDELKNLDTNNMWTVSFGFRMQFDSPKVLFGLSCLSLKSEISRCFVLSNNFCEILCSVQNILEMLIIAF